MLEVTYAAHTAILDADTGQGLLVRPLPAHNVVWGAECIHEADWAAVVADLWRRGWELLADLDGGPLLEGVTAQGRDVLALASIHPTDIEPLSESARIAAFALRARVLGLGC